MKWYWKEAIANFGNRKFQIRIIKKAKQRIYYILSERKLNNNVNNQLEREKNETKKEIGNIRRINKQTN